MPTDGTRLFQHSDVFAGTRHFPMSSFEAINKTLNIAFAAGTAPEAYMQSLEGDGCTGDASSAQR
jgi:hypothetical protein